MNNRIILLIASLAVVISLITAAGTGAWFASTTSKKQTISVSVVNTASARVSDVQAPYHTVITQGDNLVTLGGNSAALEIDNNSTVDSHIRIKVMYTSYSSGKAEMVNYSGSDTDDIDVVFASDCWAKYVNASGDCHYYYVGNGNGNKTLSGLDNLPAVPAQTFRIPAISSISYKNNISQAYSGKEVQIKVVFESKQADNVSWTQIDTYEVSGIGG